MEERKEAYEKLEKLKAYLKELQSVVIAFSGGVDSTFLLKTAHDLLGDKAIAVTANADFFPERERKEAEDFCKKERIRQIIMDFTVMESEDFRKNPKNRCYFCKKELLTKVKEIAAKENVSAVLEGSNVDDNSDYRPGLLAVAELSVLSPLRRVGLKKSEIRLLSKDMGLATFDKPSFACLASRFVYGETITEEKLSMVERGEQLLFNMGFRQARVRIHGMMARIEILPEEFDRLMRRENRECVVEHFKEYGFTYVTMDLAGYRTGSMNETLSKRQSV